MRLIVIGPVSAYLGAVDSHINAKVRSLLAPLSQLSTITGVAVTHLNKNSSSALYRTSGSVAFVAAARAVWLFAKNPDDPALRLMLPSKMNLSPEQNGMSYRLESKQDTAVVNWGETVSVSADAILEIEGSERRSERLEAMDWLREKLANGPVAQRKIKMDAEREGFSWATVRRAKDAFGVATEKSGYQGAWQWQLKDAHAQDAHRSHSDVSPFGQGVENRKLSGTAANKDAHRAERSIFEANPPMLDDVRKQPATCSQDCYEVEENMRIHRPHTGCTSMKPGAEG